MNIDGQNLCRAKPVLEAQPSIICIFLVNVKVIFYKTMHMEKKVEQYVQGEFLVGCEQKLKKKGSKIGDPCSGLGKSRLMN